MSGCVLSRLRTVKVSALSDGTAVDTNEEECPLLGEKKLARLLALLLAFALIASACGGDDDEDAEEETSDTTEAAEEAEETTTTAPPAPEEGGAEGGTLIWAHEQEPPDMHLDDPNNNLSITSWIRSALIEGLYGVSGATEYYPELLDGEATVTENDDGTVTIDYTLRDGLMWSDGTPLTSADVEYTYNIITEGCGRDDDGSIVDGGDDGCVYFTGGYQGIELITSFEVTSDTEFTINWAQFFAGWKGTLNEVYAAHAFGADANEVNENLVEWSNADGVLPSSGPMIFGEWNRGVSLSMVRNDNYAGSNSPDARNTGVAFVDGVQISFVSDTDTQINALKAGEAQIIMTQPQLAFGERLSSDENFTVASSAGPVFEHWGLNLLNVHLSDPLVREALVYGIDKTEVMAGLYTPLFGDSLPAAGLGNTFWLSNQAAYEDHQAMYEGRQSDAAKANLEAAGYTDSGDGIYEHPERGRLTLRVGTTGGNALRELQQQLIQAQMADSGFEIVIDNVDGAAYFGERPFSEEALAASSSGGAEGDPTIWDITQFAWVGGPWPGGQAPAYISGNGNNPYGYANADFDAKSIECDGTVDDAERAACYNEMDKYVTTLEIDAENGLFMIPLTQKPSYYGYLSSQLSGAGVAPDAQGAGPLANVVDFQFS
jgi:peptide/nickel transport system substrate-binding protein